MMRIVRLFIVLALLGALLAGCDGGCSCTQETAPPPPVEPQEEVEAVSDSALEVIRPDTSDVLDIDPSPAPKPVLVDRVPRPEVERDRSPAIDERRETVLVPEPPKPIETPEPIPVPEPEPELEIVLEHTIQLQEGPFGIMFAKIPEGQFMLGSDDDESGRDLDEGPTIEISLGDFWLGQSEITLRQWQAVMGHLPFRWQSGNAPPEWTLDEPVRYVSWHEAQQFLEELNSQTGNSFRLPTEPEWEYACRAWEKSNYWSGDFEADVRGTDWIGPYAALHEINSSGQFNPFGLFDMHGNVSEWVEDDYVDTYSDHRTDGSAYIYHPRLPLRIARGGNFLSSPDSSRSAAREPLEPTTRFSTIGFRIATDQMVEMASTE
jgi:formylglycine-generating enzyme required for sulfatase activity